MSRPRTAAKRSGARPARRVSGPARDAATAAGRGTSPARPAAPRPAARAGAKAPRAPRSAAPLGGAGVATAAALAPGVAIPQQRPRPRAVPAPRRAAGARLRTLPDHHLLDSLLRSRAWIVLLGIALGGIVAMQVSLLGMNAGISEAVVKSTALQQEQEVLKGQIGTLGSGEQISAEASKNGLLTPDPGGVQFLTARGPADARIAAGQLTPPSDAAKRLLAGLPSTALPEGQTTPAQQVASATASTTAVAVPGAAPGAGANVAQPTATAAPVATATAAPTAAAAATAAATTTDPAATTPQG